MLLASVTVVLSLCWCSLAFSTGAPLGVCSEGLRPGDPHGLDAQPGNGGFVIETDLPRSSNGDFQYEPGQNYTGMLVHSLTCCGSYLAAYS